MAAGALRLLGKFCNGTQLLHLETELIKITQIFAGAANKPS